MDFIESCRKFIEIDSTPSGGTLEIATYAAELCRQAGFHVEIQNESHGGVDQANVIARPIAMRPDHELLLQTHLDTGEPGTYQHWTRTGANPFNASIYQDTIYGLGSANTKLDFLCKLEAAKQLNEEVKSRGVQWKLPFVLVGTFGEEMGMSGAIKLIRKKKVSARMALVSEPTEMKLMHAGKGFAGVEIEIPFSDEEKEFRALHDLGDGTTTQSRVFSGKAAHSSFPQTGESAIAKMLDYLTRLPEGLAVMEMEGGISFNTVPAHAVLEIDMDGSIRDSMASRVSRIAKSIASVEARFKNYPDPEFDPAEPTLNIGLIRTYEDFVKLSGCCRLPPTVSHDVYQEWMEILRLGCQEVGAAFRVTDYKQPFRTRSEGPLVQVCQEQLSLLGLSPQCGAQSVANEANVFTRFGIACVVIGPGRGVGNSHAPNEHVRMEQLNQVIRFYKGVLERVCL
jgi:acetylornithine deacetylase/succinyl-diaminopimelate desuccinylase-like protein